MIHCAAGIHRTGTMSYTILRLTGYSADESMALLKTMREDTHKGVGDWRIELSEKEIYPRVMKRMQAKVAAAVEEDIGELEEQKEAVEEPAED